MAARLWRWGIVFAFVLSLELACRSGLISSFVMIPPSDMAVSLFRLVRESKWFWPDVAYTGRNLLMAAVISIFGGGVIGLSLHALPRLRGAVSPLLSSYYTVPTFILYPVLIVFFGIGPLSLIIMGAVFGIVAMIIATLIALDRIPGVLLKTARVHRLDPFRTIILLRLPAATPYLFSGVKLSIAYCIIGVIAGEFILATAGIGRRLSLAYNNFDNATMYGVLLFIIGFSAVITAILNACEKRIQNRWGR